MQWLFQLTLALRQWKLRKNWLTPFWERDKTAPYIDKTSYFNLVEWHVSNYGQQKMDYGPDEPRKSGMKCVVKINDSQPTLPSGVPVQIIDDFGDVFGVMIMLDGRWLRLRWAETVRRLPNAWNRIGRWCWQSKYRGRPTRAIVCWDNTWAFSGAKPKEHVDGNVTKLAQQKQCGIAGEVMLNGQSLTIKPNGTLSTVEEPGKPNHHSWSWHW